MCVVSQDSDSPSFPPRLLILLRPPSLLLFFYYHHSTGARRKEPEMVGQLETDRVLIYLHPKRSRAHQDLPVLMWSSSSIHSKITRPCSRTLQLSALWPCVNSVLLDVLRVRYEYETVPQSRSVFFSFDGSRLGSQALNSMLHTTDDSL